MKLIVGLGNPGIEYQFTPHNMGFLAVDRIAEQCGVRVNNRHCRAQTARTRLAGHEVVLAKPETYMNLSGASVAELVREYEAKPEEDLVLLYDELDLPFGSIRVRPRGRSAGHNGVESVIAALGTQEITRIRMGIAPDHPVGDGARYVLSQFKKSQLAMVTGAGSGGGGGEGDSRRRRAGGDEPLQSQAEEDRERLGTRD